MAKRKLEPAPTTSGFHIRPLYIILFFVLMIFVLGGVFLSQQTQLRSIAEQKEVLQDELDALKVEQERLERMLEYMQTNDYLLQYAREKLGYVFPDDVKFVEPAAPTNDPTELPAEYGDELDDEQSYLPTPTPEVNLNWLPGNQP